MRKNILSKEVNPIIINAAAIIAALMIVFMALSAETLVDYYPPYAAPIMAIYIIGALLVLTWPKHRINKRIHIDPKKIFGGIDGTSNLKEEIIISRIQQDALLVFENGASNMSLQRDLERIQFLAKNHSMRKVEDFIDKFLTFLAIEHFSED